MSSLGPSQATFDQEPSFYMFDVFFAGSAVLGLAPRAHKIVEGKEKKNPYVVRRWMNKTACDESAFCHQ